MQTATVDRMEIEHKELETQIAPLLERAIAFRINNDEDRILCKRLVMEAQEWVNRIEEKFRFTAKKNNAKKVHSDACETENAFYGPLWKSEEIYKKKAKDYDTEQEQEARRKADLDAAKRLDEENKERERLQKKAEKELDKGNVAKAEALLEQADNPTPSLSITNNYSTGKKLKTKARVTNLLKLCKLIVDGEIGINCIEIKQGELNKWAESKNIKEKFDGIELYEESKGRI